MDEPVDSAGPARRLGHGGLLAVVACLPVAALALIQAGHALSPRFPAQGGVVATRTAVTADDPACYDDPPPGAPRVLPRGYRFVSALRGSYGGPVGAETEVTWVYNRSCSDPDALYPVLVIRTAATGAELALSDPGRRRPVSLGTGHVTATYYDGWTTPDARIESPLQVPVPRWETSDANALVVSWPGGTYGILGARLNGIGLGELVAIAHQLPLGASEPCRSCG